MRNLKRALSLTLASVMLLGMMVVGAGAASFPDVDDNDNVEAIEVLNAVGVMIGDNGNFKPDTPVTRNEMAVIMAKLILGTYAADSYVGTHPFTDVPAWADRYVAACYASSIVAGRSATTYDGQSTVTAVEAAAMMLRALGYEDLSKNADRWDQPVAAKANEINLFDGMSGASNTAMNRDSVAKLALNSLKATMVTTTRTGQDIKLPDGTTIASAVNYSDRTTTTYDYTKSNGKYANGSDNKLQLCEFLYGSDLTLTSGDSDDFGRPAKVWQYKNDEAVKITEEAVATFVKSTGKSDVYKALKGYTYNSSKINDEDNDLVTYVAGKTGNGKLVEVYANDNVITKTSTDIIEVPYSLGKVSAVTTNKDGDVTYSVTKEAGSVAARSGKIYADDSKEDTAVINGSVEKDDIVTFAEADGKLYIYPTTSFEGVQTARNTNKDTVTVDGKTYDVATGITSIATTNFENSDDTCTFYVDQYGFVVKSDVVEGSTDYAVVDEIRYKNDGSIGATKAVEARLVFTDGTSQIVSISKINDLKVSDTDKVKHTTTATSGTGVFTGKDSTDTNLDFVTLSTDIAGNNLLSGKVVKFSKDGDKYEITYDVTVSNSDTTVTMNKNGTSATSAVVTEKGVPSFVYDSSTKETANKDTIYIIKTDDAKYSVYTGYQNVTKVTANASAGAKVSYSVKNDKVNVVYVDAYNGGTNKAEVGDTSNDIVYILDYKAYEQTKTGGDSKWTYSKAALNGVEGEVVSKVQFTANGFYEVTLNDDNEVKTKGTADAVPTTDSSKWLKGNVTADSGDADQVIIGGKGYVCSGAKVYVIDDDNFSEGDGTSAGIGDTVFIKTKGNPTTASSKDDITAEIVYIVKADAGSATVPGDMGASEIEKLFNEQGKDEVTVTGAISDPITVPEGKKLIVDTKPTGTVTLNEGATLELSAAMELPVVKGKGTVEIPSDVMITTPNNTDFFTDLQAKVTIVEKTVTADAPNAGETKSAEIAITAGTKFTGGKVQSYDSLHTMDEISAVTGGKAGVPVSLHKITIPGTLCDENNVIKIYYTTTTGDGTKTYTQIGLYTDPANTTTQIFGSGDGKTVPSGWSDDGVSVILPLADTVTGIKVEVFKPAANG